MVTRYLPNKGVFRALLVIDFAHSLVFVRQCRIGVDDFAARIGCLAAVWCEKYRRFAEQCRIDAVVDERSLSALIARPPLHAAEAKSVKSPAIIAAVGTNAMLSAGSCT